MSIPKHYELRVPVLNYLSEHGAAGSKTMEQPLAAQLNLTEEEVAQMYESGNGPVFKDRISWALTYLGIADLVKRVDRGLYQLTPQGIKLLETPDKVNEYIEEVIRKREEGKKKIVGEVIASPVSAQAQLTPQEELYKSFEDFKRTECSQILDRIISKSWQEFEKLVVQLLQKMGYGERIKDSGHVTKATNDKGIDGIIKEDVLGFGRIYIQAKKYGRKNGVGREDIHKFVGALAGAKANKGVLITTSYFNRNALEYVNDLNSNTTVVLIDGEQLADYIYTYSLGMQTEEVITIKKIDNDFWDSMQDDKTIL